MAELFQRDRSTISRHLKRIYDDGELSKDMTCARFACVVNRGIRGMVDDELDFYNLAHPNVHEGLGAETR